MSEYYIYWNDDEGMFEMKFYQSSMKSALVGNLLKYIAGGASIDLSRVESESHMLAILKSNNIVVKLIDANNNPVEWF